MLGDASEFRQSEERQSIMELLRAAPEPMRPKAIAETLGKKDGATRYLLHKMLESGTVDNVGGAYRLPPAPPNSANTPNIPSGLRAPSVIPNGAIHARQAPNNAEAGATVSGVRGVSGYEDNARPAELFDAGLDIGGVCDICGMPTAGESLCWSCR
jgi:hypothetical protein